MYNLHLPHGRKYHNGCNGYDGHAGHAGHAGHGGHGSHDSHGGHINILSFHISPLQITLQVGLVPSHF